MADPVDAGHSGHDSAAEQDDAGAGEPSLDRPPAENEALGRDKGCDLTGRWIMTERRNISVVGANQVAFSWYYLELIQQGDKVVMATGMNCGGSTHGLPPIEVDIDDSHAWPAYMEKVRYDGRKGASSADGEQCQISFDRAVLVRGATVSAYRDLTVALPLAEQPAKDAEPGWEDWDSDGNPGVTMSVTGTIWGSIYEARRTWSQYQGTTARDAGSLLLDHRWGEERVTLGYDSSPLLVYEGVRDADESTQLVELTRLLPTQATGDDPAKCKAIRELAPTLTPRAMKVWLD